MSTQVFLVDGVVLWRSGTAVDADGCPFAYCSKESGLHGLDYLANAGKPGNWYGILTDKNGEPVVQGPDDPAPGFYISPTSLQNKEKAITDPHRYVDSGSVPYIATPPDLKKQGVKMGDLCMVFYNDKSVAAVVADSGPKGKFGEMSIACATALGISNSPKNGGCLNGVTFVIFPGSCMGWPVEGWEDAARYLLEKWGGEEKIKEALA